MTGIRTARGAILITLIIVITAIAFLSLAVLSLSTTELYSGKSTTSFHTAQYMAESGMRYAQLHRIDLSVESPHRSYYAQRSDGVFHQLPSPPTPKIQTNGFYLRMDDCSIRSTGIVREGLLFESIWVTTRTDVEWFRPYCAGSFAAGYWAFSGNAMDSSKDPDAYDGEAVNVSLIADRRECLSRAYHFSGNGAIGAQQKPISRYPFSLAAWIKASPGAGTDGVIACLSAITDANVQYGMYIRGIAAGTRAGHVFVVARNSAGNVSIEFSDDTQTKVDDGAWHLVIAVFRSSMERKLYIDGVAYSFVAPGGPVGFDSARVDQWFIGRWGNLTSNDAYFIGDMDEVAIFDYAMTSDEAIAYFNGS